nr:BV-like protein [Cotesia vestalis bracovirus]
MKVNIADKYPYVVVQFLQLPYPDIDDYVCIPSSWIRVRRVTERESIVAYPDETPSITKMRIMNCDESSEKWKLYLAIVKVETCSYKDAYEYILNKIHNAARNRYSTVIRTGYKRMPATATKRYSPWQKKVSLLNSQSKKNRNKLKVVDKVRQSGTILNPSECPEYSNVESRTLTSLKMTSFVSLENTVIKENCNKEHLDQASGDVRSSSDDLLLRYPYIKRKPEKDKGLQVNSLAARSQSTENALHALKCSPTFVNQICDYALEPEKNQLIPIYREHLRHIALTQGIPDNRIPNLRTFTLDFQKPLIQDPNIGSNTSFTVQIPTNEVKQFSQLEIPRSSSVIQELPQDLSNQKTPDHSSEVECATSEPTDHSKITSVSHASIECKNPAEHQNSTVEDMVVDELTEVSCIEQNVFSESKAENESPANSKNLEEANHSEQNVESCMEEESPMVEAVTSREISSTQDVDDDEQSNSSELNSDEITNTSLKSHEQINQSVISLLNQTDVWADQLFDIFQKMKINFSETCQIAHDLYESLVESRKVIDCIANTSENLRALKKGKVPVVTSKDVTAEIQQIAEVNQAERKEEENLDVNMKEDKKEDNDVDSKSSENDDDCGGDVKDVKVQDEDNEVPKTTRGNIRTLYYLRNTIHMTPDGH